MLAVGDGASVAVGVELAVGGGGLFVSVTVGWEVLVGGRSMLCNFGNCVSVGKGFVAEGNCVEVSGSRESADDSLPILSIFFVQPAINAAVPRNTNSRLLIIFLSAFDDIVLEQLGTIIS